MKKIIEEALEKAKENGMSEEEYLRIYRVDRSANECCFNCKKAVCSGCSWSMNFTPVEGWIAKKSKKTDSYHIYFCPEFEEG